MLKSYVDDKKEITVEAGVSVRDILVQIGINPDLVAGVFINGDLETKDYIVQDGDTVKLLAVIGGG